MSIQEQVLMEIRQPQTQRNRFEEEESIHKRIKSAVGNVMFIDQVSWYIHGCGKSFQFSARIPNDTLIECIKRVQNMHRFYRIIAKVLPIFVSSTTVVVTFPKNIEFSRFKKNAEGLYYDQPLKILVSNSKQEFIDLSRRTYTLILSSTAFAGVFDEIFEFVFDPTLGTSSEQRKLLYAAELLLVHPEEEGEETIIFEKSTRILTNIKSE